MISEFNEKMNICHCFMKFRVHSIILENIVEVEGNIDIIVLKYGLYHPESLFLWGECGRQEGLLFQCQFFYP